MTSTNYERIRELAYLDGLIAVWEEVRDSFLDSMPRTTVELWFGNMKMQAFKDDVLTFSIDSAFKYDIINQKFLSKIEDGFEARLGFRVKVEIICEEENKKNDDAAMKHLEDAARDIEEDENDDFLLDYSEGGARGANRKDEGRKTQGADKAFA